MYLVQTQETGIDLLLSIFNNIYTHYSDRAKKIGLSENLLTTVRSR